MSEEYRNLANEKKIIYHLFLFRKIVIEADNILQPLLTFEFSPKKTDMTKLSVSIVFLRKSLLFQLQLGMILRFIANQQFSQSLLVLQLIIHNNLV